jgi:hypothetical protein
MITVRAGSGAIGVCLLLLVAGCSREQQDWRSAESADTIEGYGQFIQRHPESELATQARTRVAQLGEDRDWQHAGSADTVDSYRDFIAQHPSGKWAQEARIRIENFSLGEQAGTDAGSKTAAGTRAGRASGGGSNAAAGTASLSGAGGNASGGGESVNGASGSGGAGRVPSGHSAASTGQGEQMPTGADDDARPDAALGHPGTAASSSARSYGLASPGEAATPAGSRASAAAAAPPSTAWAAAAAASGGAVTRRPDTSAAGSATTTPSNLTATPPSRPAAAIPAKPGSTGFGIQLGAFSTEAGANTEWRLLASQFAPDLQGLQEHLVAADTPSGRIYRLQAVVGDETRARAICDSLRKHGQACVAVLPH